MRKYTITNLMEVFGSKDCVSYLLDLINDEVNIEWIIQELDANLGSRPTPPPH